MPTTAARRLREQLLLLDRARPFAVKDRYLRIVARLFHTRQVVHGRRCDLGGLAREKKCRALSDCRNRAAWRSGAIALPCDFNPKANLNPKAGLGSEAKMEVTVTLRVGVAALSIMFSGAG